MAKRSTLPESRGVSSIGTGTSVKPFSFVNSTPRDHSASRIRREPRRLAQCCALFLPTQPLRQWFGLREAAADAEREEPPTLLLTLQRSQAGCERARRGPQQSGPAPVGPGSDQMAQTPSHPHSRDAGSRPRGLPAPTAPATSCTSGGPLSRRPSGAGKGAVGQAGLPPDPPRVRVYGLAAD